eukprot:3201106-Alexandrium_andersonii.AAC.1
MASFQQLRSTLLLWQTSVSDVQGCFHLHSSQPAAPAVQDVLDADCPELLMLEAASREHWVPGNRTSPH